MFSISWFCHFIIDTIIYIYKEVLCSPEIPLTLPEQIFVPAIIIINFVKPQQRIAEV